MAITGARAASLDRTPAIAGGKHPGGHAVQHVQRSSLAAKPIAPSRTGHDLVPKKAAGDSATPTQPNSLVRDIIISDRSHSALC